jgi:hypothetical protein
MDVLDNILDLSYYLLDKYIVLQRPMYVKEENIISR